MRAAVAKGVYGLPVARRCTGILRCMALWDAQWKALRKAMVDSKRKYKHKLQVV